MIEINCSSLHPNISFEQKKPWVDNLRQSNLSTLYMGHRTSNHHNIVSWICVTDSLLSTPIAILQLDFGASSEDCQLWIPRFLHKAYNALGTTRLEKAVTLTMSALDSDESIASNTSTKSTNKQQIQIHW